MKITIKDNIFDVDVEDRKILLNVNNGLYFELNETGSILFDYIRQNEPTKKDIIAFIGKNFNLPEKLIEADLNSFVKDMENIDAIDKEND